MKNGKAAGYGRIEGGWIWVTLFFNKLLQEPAVPDEWCNSIKVHNFWNVCDVHDFKEQSHCYCSI